MLVKSSYQPSDRKEMLNFITNNPKVILEVGCREGLFTKAIKSKYDIVESWGIEPDETIKDEAEINIDKVIIDYFNKETNLPNAYFDLIIFNDVLEHMFNPWEALEKAKSLLTKQGIIIVSLPNIRHKSVLKALIFDDNFEYLPAGILDFTHIRFFTRKTMVKMFEDTGFQIIKNEPVILIKKRRWYKRITNLPRIIFNLITFNKFQSIYYSQFAFTLSVKVGQ